MDSTARLYPKDRGLSRDRGINDHPRIAEASKPSHLKRKYAGKRTVNRKPAIGLRVNAPDRDDILRDYLETLGCARSLTAWMLYRHGEHRQLVELVCNERDYRTPHEFRVAFAATKFFSKTTGLETGIDVDQVAIDTAVQAEIRCKQTNEILRQRRLGHVSDPLGSELFLAKELIAYILGPVPESFEDVGWSAGRTTASKFPYLASVYKYQGRLETTASALSRARCLVNDSPVWSAAAITADAPCSVLTRAFEIVPGNVMLVVPKNAKTGRLICYEPHLNIRLQLAVGGYMRERLSRHGINLDDQSVNQRRARLGSIWNHLATIDLRAASDTVAYELIIDLLPPEWVDLLDAIRSRSTLWPDGTLRRNEKFSSMGNGFTFELESLIFFALAKVAAQTDVSVYGDDLIVPSASYHKVTNLLEYCGFEVNMTKSFHDGPFRESCGTNSFLGFDVTPVYLRTLPKVREDVVKLHNQVRVFAQQWVYPPREFARIMRKWRTSHSVATGPQGLGDGHYHVDFDAGTPRANFWLDGWWFESFEKKFSKHLDNACLDRSTFSEDVGYAAIAAATGPKRSRSVYSTTLDRGQFKYVKIRKLASFHWPSVMWG